LKAISIHQPWAHLVVAGLKLVENRTWRTHYRGPLVIHASARAPDEAVVDYIARRHGIIVPRDRLLCGGLVGIVELVDVVTTSPDPYFEGPFGWVLRAARIVTFRPWRGRQGLFEIPEAEIRLIP